MNEPAYLRYPHLHGDLVTFVAEDDVWLAPLAGGRAWRVTADQVPVSSPRFDPSGTRLAWASRRDGAPEVHLAPVTGGEATRLTYWGNATTGVRGWTPAGEVVAVTSAGEASGLRRWAYALPVDGGPPRRLPYGWVGDVGHGPAGRVVVTSMYGKDPAYWKRYRGGSAGRLWVDTTGDGEFTRILPELTASLHSPMWVDGRIVFLSDHDGVGSLYSALPDGSDLRRHTEQEFYARAATTDGERIVYQCAGDLWLLDGLDARPRKLDIALGGPRSATRPRPISPRPDDVHPDKTGRASVVEVRGTVHWVTHRDGPVRALAEQPGVRARLPRVVGDGVVWVTDADGEEGLEFAPAGGVEPGNTPRRVAVGKVGRVLELEVAPDGRRLAVATHDGRLLLVDVESGEVREVLKGANPHVSDLAFSPDSNWLAWSHPGPGPLRHIRMTNTTDLSVVDVTPLRFADFSPTFTEDGRFLAFLSVRTFDPVYDAHVFDLAFPTGCRPFLLPLAATTPSPFDPLRLGRPVGDDEKDKDKDKEHEENPITVVDLDGLADRLVPVPVAAAGYSSLTAAKGGLLWLRSPVQGVLGDTLATPSARPPRSVLERFDLAKSRTDVLVDGLDGFAATGDGQRVVVLDSGDLRVVPSDRKVDVDDPDSIDVDLSRIRVVVDRAAEWRQSYAEAGRLMRDLFWRTDMGGVDWAGVLDRYRPLVDRLGSYSDLVDLLWEVQGELGTSHAYVIPSGGGSYGRPVGLLGADLERDESGAWRVTRVIPGETSDPAARSPLAAPGVAVRAGDAIVAVDGRQVDPLTGPAPLLVGTAGKPVELTVRPGGGGEPRRVVVVPLEDDEPLRYHAWVADRRARTHELSDGRVGYLHVPDMMGAGWAQLHRDLRVELQREAVVLDVRENAGGHTSQLVVEKLARRIIGWSVARGFTTSESYPADAPRGPVVAIADEFAGSDGDIVNVAIKELDIGPVVGTRTWGGVIGIDLAFDLVDGTVVTQPRYALWFAGHGWGVENHGVDPDIEVVMTPQDRVAGRDPQLDTAVKLALESLADRPAAVPPQLPPLT